MKKTLIKSSDRKGASDQPRLGKDSRVILTTLIPAVHTEPLAKKVNKKVLRRINLSPFEKLSDKTKPKGWYGAKNDFEQRKQNYAVRRTNLSEDTVSYLSSENSIPSSFNNKKGKYLWNVQMSPEDRLNFHLSEIAHPYGYTFEIVNG